MSSIFRPTTVQDEPQVIDFLVRIFAVARDAPLVHPPLLRWKYWEPRSDCPDPRSFVIEKDARIVAHVGLWPVTLQVNGITERGTHMIDWASDPQVPGAGVSLLQRLTKSYDFIYSIGGSDMTQTILPKFGFRIVAQAPIWARPIRPLRQMLHHQTKDMRLPIRLARNIWWSKTPSQAIEPGWSAVPAETLDLQAGERGEAFFRYLEKCPVARCLTFRLLRHGKPAGVLALAIVQQQTRVSGIWLEDPSPENWRTAFLLAQEATLQHTGTSEIMASCATEAAATAAGLAGMRVRGSMPVFLFRKAGGTVPLQFQLADNDAFFLGGPLTEFLT